MDLRATLCPDRLLPWPPSIFYRPRSLPALLIAAHFKIHAEHNWSPTRRSWFEPARILVSLIHMAH
jgi:hypothetical protein